MNDFVITADDEQGTLALGQSLSKILPDGSVVALIGPLGAGKTRLVQAFCGADGLNPRDVVSPTFVLVHEYRGRRPVFHFDAYRLKDDDEFLALGPEEYFEGSGVTFVEWADRVERCMPRDRLEITIDVLGPTARKFSLVGYGTKSQEAVWEIARSSNPSARRV